MSFHSVSIINVLKDPCEIKNFVESYNIKIDKVPTILKNLLGSERVNIKILANNGYTFRIGYETRNGRIIRIIEGDLENSTINVRAMQSTIEKINGSKDPVATFRKERNAGNITIKGQDIATRIKLDLVLSNDTVLWFFYNILFG